MRQLHYSQNLALKEKKQVQSAHFSGKQQMLHNTILYKPNKAINFPIIYEMIQTTTMFSLSLSLMT